MRDEIRIAGIDIQSIPVGSGLSAAVLIVILLGAMFIELPGVRGVAVWGGAAGLVFGVGLILWRRRHAENDWTPKNNSHLNRRS